MAIDIDKELRKCLAALFRQKGKDIMTEREFVYAASMDLHWFAPKEAQTLLEISLKCGLLRLSNGTLSPSFEISDDMIELDYKPSREIIIGEQKGDEHDPFMALVDKISTSSGLQKRQVIAGINKVREKMPVDIEVAALIFARNLGIDISMDIKSVRDTLMAR
ncbi:MAG: DUF2240 family protein [Thermoplasmata archaeon]